MTNKQIEKAWRCHTGQKISCENCAYEGLGSCQIQLAHDTIKYVNNLEKIIRKQVAMSIFQAILEDYKGVDYYDFLFDGIQAIADDDYGIRIMPGENGVIVTDKDDE